MIVLAVYFIGAFIALCLVVDQLLDERTLISGMDAIELINGYEIAIFVILWPIFLLCLFGLLIIYAIDCLWQVVT